MNQIPNIEETDNTRDVEDVVESLLKEAINDFDMAKASAGREVSFSYWFKEEITKALHHQLQKAKEEERERIIKKLEDNNYFNVRETLNPPFHSELDQDKV